MKHRDGEAEEAMHLSIQKTPLAKRLPPEAWAMIAGCLLFIGLGFALIMGEMRSNQAEYEAAGKPDARFKPALERYAALYAESTKDMNDTAPLPARYTGKIAFLHFQRGVGRRGGRLGFIWMNANRRNEAGATAEQSRSMFALDPEETEFIVVIPVEPGWQSDLPLEALVTVIHVPTGKAISRFSLSGPVTEEFAIPHPGVNYRRPGDPLMGYVPKHECITWRQLLSIVVSATDWECRHHALE